MFLAIYIPHPLIPCRCLQLYGNSVPEEGTTDVMDDINTTARELDDERVPPATVMKVSQVVKLTA